jgi:hypothetical protein
VVEIGQRLLIHGGEPIFFGSGTKGRFGGRLPGS